MGVSQLKQGCHNALPDSEMPQSFEELPETDPRYQGKAEFELPASRNAVNSEA